MMLYLCCLQPHVTSLNASWSEVLELPIRWRDRLMRRLDEIRTKEVSAIRSARR